MYFFLYPSQWKLHNRYYRSVHLKLKPYSCEKCQKSFTLADTLKKHMIWAHSDERPHNCDKCNKSFAIKNQLANHVKVVHEKMRRFECSHCHMKFGQKATLEKHVARFVFYILIFKKLPWWRFELKDVLRRPQKFEKKSLTLFWCY